MVLVRAELGVAGARRRRLDSVGLLRRGDRGGAHRDQVPHARLPALGRVPRERLRAVAHPGRRDAPGHLDEFATAPNDDDAASSRTSATPRRSRGRGRSPGRPGLEHRIGGLEKEDETGNVSYDPENHDRMVRLRAAKVAGIAADIPELEVDDPGRRRHARPRLGLDVRRDRRGGAARARERAQGRDGAPPPPEPVPAQHGRGRARLRQGARPGDEPRAAADADPRRVPRRRGRATTRCAGGRSGRRSSRTRSRRWWTRDATATATSCS